jgi:Putative phage integrase/Phage integrase family
VILDPVSEHCRELRTGVRGKTILINVSPADFVLLKEPTAEEMADLVRRFREEQANWLRRLLTTKASEIGGTGAKKDAIYGAAYYAPTGKGSNGQLRFFNSDALPPAAFQVLEPHQPVEGWGPLSRVTRLSMDEARRFVDAALGPTITDMASVMRKVPREQFVMPELEQMLSDAGNPRACFERLNDYCRLRFWPDGQRLDASPMHVPFLLMLFLHREGFVLFPVWSVKKQYGGLNIPELLYLTTRRSKLLQSTLHEVSEVAKGYGGSARPGVRLSTIIRQILLRSTITDVRDVSADLWDLLYDYETTNSKTGQVLRISSVTYKVLRNWSERAGMNIEVERTAELEGRDLFAWTRDPYRFSVPPGIKDYRPNKVIAQWAEDLQEAFSRLNNLYVDDHRAAVNAWLAYLLTLNAPPTRIEEVDRHVHIRSSARSGRCFRKFVEALPTGNDTKNNRLRSLAQLFKLLIDLRREKIDSPIDYELDKFPGEQKRGKTPRMPLSREMLEYIKDFNKRDDYAFSRGLGWHDVERRDPETGKMKKVWWPGVAILTEALLDVPVRGFQARFLDSGLGDELVIDHDTMEMVANTSPLARVGRQQGVFYVAQDKDEKPVLGLYINTNKTGVDNRGGYRIPWCPPSLADNLQRLMRWNAENDNVSECPLLEKMNYAAIKNPIVKAQVGTTYAIFRDPIVNDGWPCQKKRLTAYWNSLLRAVELELAQEGFKYRLTKEVVEADGTVSYQALYDIHTLRVSGITALLEAGMPPELVQEVVGHASIPMTLYYNKVRAARLNELLTKLYGERKLLPADLPELQGESVEDLLSYLTCTRAAEDAAGRGMVAANPSGFGNGSFNIFPDGICPGGDCSTGGEFSGSYHLPVPRHRACSLCRYRLTGPMFLVGLVYNANRLMYELRQIGADIRNLVREAEEVEDNGGNPAIIRNQINALYRRTEDVAIEWGLEVQYVEIARRMLEEQLNAEASGDRQLPVLISAEKDPIHIVARAETKSDFYLLQQIVEGAELLPGFRPDRAAITDHREFLNEVLSHSGVDPFLLTLDGMLRDRAARLLGEAFVTCVPDGRMDALRTGKSRLGEFDERLGTLISLMAKQVAMTKRVDFASLIDVMREPEQPPGLIEASAESTELEPT